jgi:hypothetical protein
MKKSLTDICRCGHTRKEHCYGETTDKNGWINTKILDNGSGRCCGTSIVVPGEPGPCGCPKFSTVPYK